MNAFVILALALYFWHPDSLRLRILIGALFGVAMMVKLVAVLPLGFLVLGDLFWRRPNRDFVRRIPFATAPTRPRSSV